MARTLAFEDRQRAVDELASVRTAGRLDAAEYGRRLDLVLTASTPAQLDTALGRAETAPIRSRRRDAVPALLAVLAAWVVVLVVVALVVLPAPGGGGDEGFATARSAAPVATAPALPPPGAVQPPDPGLATVAVQQVFALAFDGGVDRAARVAAIEDGAELVPAMQQIAAAFPDQVAENRTTVLDVVFTSDVRASVRYELTSLGERVGEAAVVDGRWVVTQATVCEVYAAAGVGCFR